MLKTGKLKIYKSRTNTQLIFKIQQLNKENKTYRQVWRLGADHWVAGEVAPH